MGRHAAPQAPASRVATVHTDSLPMVPVTDPNLFSAPIVAPAPAPVARPRDDDGIDEQAQAAQSGLQPRSARSALTGEVPLVLPTRLSGRSLLDRAVTDRSGARRKALGLDLDVVLASGAVVLAGGVVFAAIVAPRL